MLSAEIFTQTVKIELPWILHVSANTRSKSVGSTAYIISSKHVLFLEV